MKQRIKKYGFSVGNREGEREIGKNSLSECWIQDQREKEKKN